MNRMLQCDISLGGCLVTAFPGRDEMKKSLPTIFSSRSDGAGFFARLLAFGSGDSGFLGCASGNGQAIIAPAASSLIAIPIAGTAEAVKIPFRLLDEVDQAGLVQFCGFDAKTFGDTANGLDMHGPSRLSDDAQKYSHALTVCQVVGK